MKKLFALLTLLPALTFAQDDVFWHPEASAVVVAGPYSATVCQWWPSPISFLSEVWECEDVPAYGAKWPVEIQLQSTGPVRVYARWAYARDAEGALVPMSRWMP
jgi:hypothetical protein